MSTPTNLTPPQIEADYRKIALQEKNPFPPRGRDRYSVGEKIRTPPFGCDFAFPLATTNQIVDIGVYFDMVLVVSFG